MVKSKTRSTAKGKKQRKNIGPGRHFWCRQLKMQKVQQEQIRAPKGQRRRSKPFVPRRPARGPKGERPRRNRVLAVRRIAQSLLTPYGCPKSMRYFYGFYFGNTRFLVRERHSRNQEGRRSRVLRTARNPFNNRSRARTALFIL